MGNEIKPANIHTNMYCVGNKTAMLRQLRVYTQDGKVKTSCDPSTVVGAIFVVYLPAT